MNFVFCKRESQPLYISFSHTHDVWEIILNHKGESDDIIGGGRFHFGTHTFVCIPPHVPHEKRSENGFCDFAILCRSLDLPNNGKATVINDDEQGSVSALVSILFSIYQKKEDGYRENCESLFSAIEKILLSRAGQPEKDPVVANLINVMINEFSNPDFSLTDLVRKSGYCDDYLRRKFQKSTGMSMLEYLTDLRINSAKKLLRENSRLRFSISQISTMSGFADIGYFSRVFKKRTGLSPSDYMKKYLDHQ